MDVSFSQIIEIYRAGIQRGMEESSAYEWGGSPNGKWYDELEDFLVYDAKLISEEDFKLKIKEN